MGKLMLATRLTSTQWPDRRAKRLAMLGLVVGCMPITASQSQVVHQMTASRHPTVALSDAAVDTILRDASTALKVDDDGAPGVGDLACDVTFLRSAVTSLFVSSATPANPASRAAIEQVLAEPAFVKAVASINFCDRAASFQGCARQPGRSIAVVHPGHARGLVWAHEYGHSTGLGHRGTGRELMRGDLASAQQNFINAAECTSFQRGAPALHRSRVRPRLVGAAALPSIATLLDAAIVDRFPYELFARYPASAARSVLPVLDDPARALSWSNAATLVGIVGDATAAQRLLRLASEGPVEGVDGNTHHRARLAAVFALGYYLNRRADAAIEAQLSRWAQGQLPSQAGFSASSERVADDRPTSFRLTALWALALAGRSSSATLFDNTALLAIDAATRVQLKDTYRTVRARGLARYYANSAQ